MVKKIEKEPNFKSFWNVRNFQTFYSKVTIHFMFPAFDAFKNYFQSIYHWSKSVSNFKNTKATPFFFFLCSQSVMENETLLRNTSLLIDCFIINHEANGVDRLILSFIFVKAKFRKSKIMECKYCSFATRRTDIGFHLSSTKSLSCPF